MKFHVVMTGLVLLITIFNLFDVSSSTAQSEVTSSSGCNYKQHCSYPRDCYEIRTKYSSSNLTNGLYDIQPSEFRTNFQVYCDFNIDGGGWTVFQRRVDGSVDFKRNWYEYSNGFGFLSSEFWLGNEKLAYITAQKTYELRIELVDKLGDPFYVKYSPFRIGHSNTNYKLLLGQFSGNTTADSLDYHRNQAFTTYDADNDHYKSDNCAVTNGGGWWHNRCDRSNLNGIFGIDSDYYPGGMDWDNLPGGSCALKFSEMKIRPVL